MAETHELRLKINAAAARAGSREFIGAIENIKRAVIDLERASDGTFKRLSKNARDAGKAARVKIEAVDRSAIRNLDEFAKIQAQVIRQTANSRNSLTGLLDGLRNVTSAYSTAAARSDGFGTALNRTNTALARQAQLLTQVANASRRTGTQATPQASSQTAQTDRAAQQQVAMQNRVKRAVDDTRLATERLVTQLMKVGGFGQINSVSRAFRDFQKEVSRTSLTTSELDAAKTRLNTSMRNAQTAVVTLTAKEKENARATREAAAASRAHEEAARRQSAAAREAAASAKQQSTSLERQQSVALSSAAALRRATEETARLSERMRRMGDTRGLASINSALNAFRTNVGSGVTSANQLRVAISQFSSAASNAKVSLTQMEGTQRRAADSARTLASQQRDAANQARRVEREMRSVAGASSAASRAFREATGSMRGMENAFSATYQIGSAFRVLMGSITMGTFIQGIYQAGAALEQFRVTMEVATGSVAGAADQMDFIDGMARTLGTNLRTARDDFSKFAVSANLAGVEADTARGIFRSVSSAMTVMGRGAEDQRLAFLALEQMLSKNVISSEELRRQLGERLPGAVNLMAKAVGVSTQELNKLLKAGALISSEVLPAFAREVDAAFGPGLTASLERAPAALGRFRNELEFFMSTVADSGFMTALADGFDSLTESMRSEEMQDAARKLGAGLADLTQLAVAFSTAFVENINTVARVAKAVVAGLLVRQFILLGNAVVTSAQRASIGFSTLAASMTGNSAAANSNTMAVVANNKARSSSVAHLSATSLAFDANTSRQNVNTAAVAANSAAQTRLGRAVSVAGRAAGKAGGAMGIVTRILGGLAGPVGLAISAVSLLPLMFGKASASVDDMADDIEGAIRRSGASFEKLGAQIQRTTSDITLSAIVNDIDILTSGLNALGPTVNAETKNLKDFISAVNEVGVINTSSADRSFFGASADDLDKLSSQSMSTILQLSEMAAKAAETGEGFLHLKDSIAAAMVASPESASLLEALSSYTDDANLLELSLLRNRDRLVEFYGTSNDKLIKGFADTARQVVATGEGMEDLQRRMKSLGADSPEIANSLASIYEAVTEAFNTNQSELSFNLDVSGQYNSVALQIEDFRERTKRAQAAALRDFENFNSAYSNVVESLFVPTSLLDLNDLSELNIQISSITDELERFKDFDLGTDKVESFIDSFSFANNESKEFAEALSEQFSLLSDQEKTYSNLSRIIYNLSKSYDSASISDFQEALRQNARSGNEASLSLQDYVLELQKIEESLPTGQLRDDIAALVEQTHARIKSTEATREANAAQRDFINLRRQEGSGLSDATKALQAYAEVYDRVGTSATEAQTALSLALSQAREQAEIRGLEGADADVARYFASFGPGGKLVADANAEIASMKQQVIEFQQQTGGVGFAAATTALWDEITLRQAAVDRFVSQQEMLIRAQNMGDVPKSDSALLATIREVNEVLPSYSSATQRVVDETIKAARAAADSGQGFVELNQKIQQAISAAPTAAPLLGKLQSVMAEALRTEESIVAARLSTQNLFNSDYGDRVAKSFADMGARVVTGTATVQELHEELSRITDEAPHLKERLSAIFTEAMRSMESGDSSLFLSRIVDLVDQSGVEFARMRQEAQMTATAADDAANEFANSFRGVLGSLRELTSNPETAVNLRISDTDVYLLAQATEEFKRLNETAIKVSELGPILNGLYFPTEETRAFATALNDQFKSLPAAQQNFANLDAIISRLGQSYPTVQGTAFVENLRQTVLQSTEANDAVDEYISSLDSIQGAMPTPELRELIQGLIDAANAKRETAQAAAQAEGAIIGAGNAAATAGGQAAGSAAGFYQLAAAARAAFSAISNVSSTVGSAMTGAASQIQREIDIAGMSDREAFVARRTDGLAATLQTEADAARAKVQALSDTSPARAAAQEELNRVLNQQATALSGVRKEAGRLFDVQAAARASSKSGGSGGGGGGSGSSAAELTEQQSALKALTEGVLSHTQSLAAQNVAYSLLLTNQTSSETAARLLGEAMVAGVSLTEAQTQAIIEQSEAAEKLNAQLEILANDPVNAWMNSVPSWIEAGRQIEESAIRAVSDSFKELLKTGELSMSSLAQTIIGAAIDIVADKAVKGLIGLLGGNVTGQGEGGFGLGKLLGGLFGGVDESGPGSVFKDAGGAGDAAAIRAAFMSGGQQAAALIQQALASGGQQAGLSTQRGMAQGGFQAQQQIQVAHQTGGTQAGVRVRSAHASGGASAGASTRIAHRQGASSLRQGVQTGAQVGGSIMAGKIQAAAAGGSVSGGGGGGGFGFLGSLLSVFFSEGGLTSAPSPVNTPTQMPVDIFRNAPQYSEGTTNTSGIPAILHDNEAVVPLSKGRKIPVEMESRSAEKTIVQNITIQTPNPREFNNSRGQIGAQLRRAVSTGQRAD